MNREFEWTDFATLAPNAIAESLDAAGVDAAVPSRYPRDVGGPPAARDIA